MWIKFNYTCNFISRHKIYESVPGAQSNLKAAKHLSKVIFGFYIFNRENGLILVLRVMQILVQNSVLRLYFKENVKHRNKFSN